MDSWIEAFIEHTSGLESPILFRKWAAIATLSATLEQKVWLKTGVSTLYPNLYVFIVGHPGVGKSRTVNAAANFFRDLPEPHISPTSMTMASMVDALLAAKRLIMRHNEDALDYNSMYIVADELSAFIPKWDEEIAGGLTTFYDVSVPYGQSRRGNDIKIKIKHPQLSILSGTTPSNLMRLMPEAAWDQGFASRVIMVYSDERITVDIFAENARVLSDDLLHDLKLVNTLVGQFSITADYKKAILNWREAEENFPPKPTHPKLTHYNARRLAHLLKLSMVSVIDKSNELLLTKDDFNRALGWLIEAEETMPYIFQAGAVGGDAKVMEEIRDFVKVSDRGRGVPIYRIVNFAKERVPAYGVLKVIEVMEKSGMIKATHLDPKTGIHLYQALDSHQSQMSGAQGGKSGSLGGGTQDYSLDDVGPVLGGTPSSTH